MILLALLLAALGIADLVRSRLSPTRTTWLAALFGILTILLGVAGAGLDWWWSPVGAVAVIGWLVATREGSGLHRSGYWAIGALVLVVVAAVVFGPSLRFEQSPGSPTGVLLDWYAALPYAALTAVSFTTFALTVGGLLFLFETSNVIVRLALRAERTDPADDAVPAPTHAVVAPRRWWQRSAPPAEAETIAAPEFTELKGGRFIGPLERIFLLALVISGQFTAIAAIVAAKGIIRFPEISKDAPGGSKAEYFLVGSFASWALVVVVAVLITFGATGPHI
jgi:hypothetical protein